MAERSVASVPDFTSDERLRAGSAAPSGARDPLPPPFIKTTTQESGLRENCTSRLSERAEAGRKPHLSRLYIDEVAEGDEVMEKRERQEGITTEQAKGRTQRWQPLLPNLRRVNEADRRPGTN